MLLCTWVGKLCERIVANSSQDFYKGIAELLREFVLYDKRIIDEIKTSMAGS